jgi:predicted nucleic acid-binding protein
VALIVDAGCLVAFADADEPRHREVRETVRTERGTLVTTELVTAEADYLILERLGVDAELAFLQDLAEGSFIVDCLDRSELAKAREVVARYRDLRLGLADASLVVLAARYGTTRILTFDERAFRAVTPLQGGAFSILPADSG